MDFPQGNKQKPPVVLDQPSFGATAKVMEEHLSRVNWRTFLKAYAIGFGVVVASLFIAIVVIRAAFHLF